MGCCPDKEEKDNAQQANENRSLKEQYEDAQRKLAVSEQAREKEVRESLV